MSAASTILAAVKRPTTWALGVIVSIVNMVKSQLGMIHNSVSRLTGDPWRRDSVMRAFQNENGFHVTPVCDSFNLYYSMETQVRKNDLRKRAMEVIKTRHADLLHFGEVTDQNTVMIYAVNDHGYCDLRPRKKI